jgi:hypothetical protein
MLVKTYFQPFLITAILSTLLFSSCSLKEEVQPAQEVQPTAQKLATGIETVNNRLVFADQKTFEQARTILESIGTHATSDKELASWEQALHFTSLRAVAAVESSKLEQLEANGTPTPEYDLLDSFGFPSSYAAIISPAGEYQIGDKIYWFHKGFKYQANSEEELVRIKQNPEQATAKFQAGLSKNKVGTNANSRVASNNPDADDKYVWNFYITGESGSYRRSMYATRIYTEDQGYGFVNGVNSHFFRSSVLLVIKFEYYSYGKRKWYPVGQDFTWQANVNFTGNAFYPGQPPFPIIYDSSVSQSGSFSNGYFSLNLASTTTLTTPSSTSSGDIGWSYQITGSLNGYPTSDPVHNYYVNNSPLW